MLDIRLFAGFDVRRSGEPVRGLESRKVKALLAYLLLNRERCDLTRGHLTTLFWPEEDGDTGRQNLRQAIYNLRKTLQERDRGAASPIVTSRESVSFSRSYWVWLDVDEFESAVKKGLAGGECVHPVVLGEATELYRGPFLSGLFVDESPEFEEWILARQEHFRDSVLEVLRVLVSFHLGRGDLDQGLLFARRWVDIDPVSEEAHRVLMMLYARSGRRARALAQYERCRQILSMELGVGLMKETNELYQKIKVSEVAATEPIEPLRPVGPVLPLVGRSGEISKLRSIWSRVLAGEGRMSVLTGPAGIGKSRLAKAFVDEASALSGTGVLLGRCRTLRLPRCYEPFADVIRNAASQDDPVGEILRAGLDSGDFSVLAFGRPGGRKRGPATTPPLKIDPERLADAFALFLERVLSSHVGEHPSRLIVLLEDLAWVDSASVRVLDSLVPRLAGKQIWFLATCRTDQVTEDHPIWKFLRRQGRDENFDRLELGPLDDEAIEKLAKAFAGDRDAPRLTTFLRDRWGGVPVVAAEWVNLLRDEDLLVPAEGGRWNLDPCLETWAKTAPANLEEVILRRIKKLPASARRLLTLGSAIGDDFETEILENAADEMPVVLEAALGVLVERWFARHSPRSWFESRRERDVVLWREGARKGRFEFANKSLQRIVYESTARAHRKVMHAEVGRAVERRFAGELDLASEELSHHFLLAEEWAAALPHLEASADKALRLGASDIAREYGDAAIEVAARIAASTPPAQAAEAEEGDGVVTADPVPASPLPGRRKGVR